MMAISIFMIMRQRSINIPRRLNALSRKFDDDLDRIMNGGGMKFPLIAPDDPLTKSHHPANKLQIIRKKRKDEG